MSRNYLLILLLSIMLPACDKEDSLIPEPSIEMESSITSIVDDAEFVGEPGNVIEFSVEATAPAGFKSFTIGLYQGNIGQSSTYHSFVEIFAGSPEVVSNGVEYTFSRELVASDFSDSETSIRAVITDINDKTATRGFKLIKK